MHRLHQVGGRLVAEPFALSIDRDAAGLTTIQEQVWELAQRPVRFSQHRHDHPAGVAQIAAVELAADLQGLSQAVAGIALRHDGDMVLRERDIASAHLGVGREPARRQHDAAARAHLGKLALMAA